MGDDSGVLIAENGSVFGKRRAPVPLSFSLIAQVGDQGKGGSVPKFWQRQKLLTAKPKWDNISFVCNRTTDPGIRVCLLPVIFVNASLG